MKLLLHCCCAPCSVSPVASLRAESIEPCLFWYNPNIHPFTEYDSRLNCLKEFAKNKNLELKNSDAEYGLRYFLSEIYIDDKNRCSRCYEARLLKTAARAAKDGYDAFSSTLLVSPYQDHMAIKRAGEEIASKLGVEFFYRDFRPLFREGQAAARAAGLYLQKYCGCVFSEEERYAKKLPPWRGDAE